jgi:alanine racemase
MDSRPTLAEIDLAALRHNYFQVRRSIPEGCGILAVVKADAYGHGFMDVSRELEFLDVTAFGVAFLAEGIQLRKAGIDRPVLLLGGIYPGQERKCVGYGLSTVIFNLEQARALDVAAGKLFRKARIHLKVDTGMGRLGIHHLDAPRFLAELKGLRNLEMEGIISHFASADELDDDGRRFTEIQSKIFSGVRKPHAGKDSRPRMSTFPTAPPPSALTFPSATWCARASLSTGRSPPPISRGRWTCSR